jgi:hypothetical protein
MNLVLTMAGRYNRFKLFGSKVPKYLLPLATKTVLMELIRQYLLSFPTLKIYLVANRADQLFFPIVRSIVESFESSNIEIIYIDDTVSQVETATCMTNFRNPPDMQEAISFANIDTILFGREQYFEKLSNMAGTEVGFLDTFKGYSNQYSYCLLDKEDMVSHVSEKKVISAEACSGLYGFGSYEMFLKNAKELMKKNRTANFSDLYNYLIEKNISVMRLKSIGTANTIVLGTPEEYVKNIHRFR